MEAGPGLVSTALYFYDFYSRIIDSRISAHKKENFGRVGYTSGASKGDDKGQPAELLMRLLLT